MVSISTRAFEACTNLTVINFPEAGNISVGFLAFSGCQIASFVVESSISCFDGHAFNSIDLSSFTCPDDHQCFCVRDGVLFSKNGSVLIMYPAGKSRGGVYEVPTEVQTIEAYSFYDATCAVKFPANSQIDKFSKWSFAFWAGSSIEFQPSCPLTTICVNSFCSAYALRVFTITANVTTIENGAFQGSGIREFRIAPDVTRYMTNNGVLMADAQTITVVPPNFTSFTVPSVITTISDYAFAYTSIEYVDFEPHSRLAAIGIYAFASSRLKCIDFDLQCPLVKIDYRIFSQCPLANMTIPYYVHYIDGAAFASTGLTEFLLPPNHPYLALDHGVLYDRNFTILWSYPPCRPGTQFVFLPTTVRTTQYSFHTARFLREVSFPIGSKMEVIGYGTFESCANMNVDFTNAVKLQDIQTCAFIGNRMLTDISIPDSVSQIGINAFYMCQNLVRVKLPASLSVLGKCAFEGCTKLKYIDFDPYCPLAEIPSACFSASTVENLVIPWRLKSVDPSAFANAVVSLTFISWPRTDVLAGFSGHTTLKYLYVPCECADWSPQIAFASGVPEIIVCCPTAARRHNFRGLLMFEMILSV